MVPKDAGKIKTEGQVIPDMPSWYLYDKIYYYIPNKDIIYSTPLIKNIPEYDTVVFPLFLVNGCIILYHGVEIQKQNVGIYQVEIYPNHLMTHPLMSGTKTALCHIDMSTKTANPVLIADKIYSLDKELFLAVSNGVTYVAQIGRSLVPITNTQNQLKQEDNKILDSVTNEIYYIIKK